MKNLACLMMVGAVLSGDAYAARTRSCPVPGELLHWQADYCLFKVGTDDIIAAGPCLDRETQVRFRSSCTGKRFYKRALCKLVIDAGRRPGPVASCVEDPRFVGPTVRDGGA